MLFIILVLLGGSGGRGGDGLPHLEITSSYALARASREQLVITLVRTVSAYKYRKKIKGLI